MSFHDLKNDDSLITKALILSILVFHCELIIFFNFSFFIKNYFFYNQEVFKNQKGINIFKTKKI